MKITLVGAGYDHDPSEVSCGYIFEGADEKLYVRMSKDTMLCLNDWMVCDIKNVPIRLRLLKKTESVHITND